MIGGPVGGPGTALANSTTLTDISAAPQVTLPANFLNYVGSSLRLTAFGSFSTTGTPTLLLGFYYGGVAGTALGTSGAVTTASGAVSFPWRLLMEVTVRTTGSSGTVMTSGSLLLGTALTAFSSIPVPNAALATVTVDTTTAKAITVGAQWGTASSSNTITCQDMIVQSLV